MIAMAKQRSIGQIPNYLIYSAAGLAIITAILAITSQDYND